MSDRDLIDAAAQVAGEDTHGIRRRSFTLTGPDATSLVPACLHDVLLDKLLEVGTVDWDAVRGDDGFPSRSTYVGLRLRLPRA